MQSIHLGIRLPFTKRLAIATLIASMLVFTGLSRVIAQEVEKSPQEAWAELSSTMFRYLLTQQTPCYLGKDLVYNDIKENQAWACAKIHEDVNINAWFSVWDSMIVNVAMRYSDDFSPLAAWHQSSDNSYSRRYRFKGGLITATIDEAHLIHPIMLNYVVLEGVDIAKSR